MSEVTKKRVAEKRRKMREYIAANPIVAPQAPGGAKLLPSVGLFMDPQQLRASKFTGNKCPKCGVHTDTYINVINNLGKCRMCATSLMVTDKGLTAFKRPVLENAYTGECLFWWHGGSRKCSECKTGGKREVPAYCGKSGFINPAENK